MSDLPSSIGPYQIERELGRGGMGIVYLALDPRLGRRIALKLLPADFAGDPERRARLKREAQALAALNHPNIATLHAFDESDGRPFLVMEHVEGDALSAAISHRRSPIAAAIGWCEQIARGMAAAHDAGILHRDLKPANIRIRADGLVKILDFGLARSSASAPTSLAPTVSTIGFRTVSGGVLGTPGYLAPEQARGEPVDRRADVFSFGCVLYECLAAQPAFRGASTAELLAAVMRDEPDWSALPPETPAQLRRLLERCLAKDPQQRLRDLADAALELRESSRSGAGGPGQPAAARPTPNNLPRELTTLIGREAELTTIAQLLAASPLVTLIGSGGCGKTRLALRAARAALPQFPDGVWFIDLSAIANTADVAGLAVRAARIPAGERPDLTHTARLIAAIGSLRVLLVFDNAEHVIDGVRELVQAVAASTESAQMLITSREALGLAFEQAYRVPSLGLPPLHSATPAAIETSESGKLFIERARLADPSFRLKPDDAPIVAGLCSRLDGLALAIELAAARTSSMSIRDLDARLGDALRVIVPGGSGGSVPRHATIRTAIEWSVKSLPSDESRLFQQLATFSGGWTLAAAEAVCSEFSAATSSLLSRLVSRSLVQFSPSTGRYRFLETVRQFAAEILSKSPCAETLARHADYYLGLAERSAEATPGSSSTSLAVIDDDVQNIHAALHTLEAMPAEDDRLARLAFAMHKWWNLHGAFDEGLKWLAVARTRRQGRIEQFDGRLAAAAGNLEWSRGRFVSARTLFSDALEIFQRLGDHRRVAAILSNMAITSDRLGDAAAARECHQRAVDLYLRIGDEQGLAFARLNLSSLLIHEERFEEAIDMLQACLPVLEQLGDRHRCGVALHNLGEARLRSGDPHSALAALQQAVSNRDVAGDRNGAAHSQLLVGLCLAELDDPLAAAAALGRGSIECAKLGVKFVRDEASRVDSACIRLRAKLGAERFQTAWNVDGGSTLK